METVFKTWLHFSADKLKKLNEELETIYTMKDEELSDASNSTDN